MASPHRATNGTNTSGYDFRKGRALGVPAYRSNCSDPLVGSFLCLFRILHDIAAYKNDTLENFSPVRFVSKEKLKVH
jgi:hypothetical protein